MTDPRYSSVPPPSHSLAPSPQATPTPWQAPVTGATHATFAQPPAPRRRRVPGWIVAVAAVTAVAAVASFLTVLLWPAGEQEDPVAEPSGPLAFLRFEPVARVEFDQLSRTTLTSVEGDHGYTGWESGGDLHVIAFDVATGAELWRREVPGPARWSRLIGIPGAVLALEQAGEDADDQPRRMFVLDAETGAQLWHRDVRGDDVLAFLDGGLAWLDHQGRALRGLDLATGGERWRHDFPTEEASSAVAVLNHSDLTRPTDEFGEPAPGIGDHRVVMINGDRSVLVIDGDTGAILSQARDLADPEDQVLGYGERLYVAGNEVDYELVSYDLAQLSAAPRRHYAPAGNNRYPIKLQPCGQRRVCLLESPQSDSTQTEVVAVNAIDGGQIWRAPVDAAERLFGVGEWAVTVSSLGFQPTVSVLDQTGAVALESPGLAVRLNDANLLVLTTAGGYEEYVEGLGMPVGGEEFGLGRLPENMIQEECSWNAHYLICPDRNGAEIWRFAQPA
jgi:molecular chaperone HscA